MNPGYKLGGPVANPIREMIDSNWKEGVIFRCGSKEKAESSRYAALMLKRRNGYSYKTMRKGSVLTVYKDGADPFELHGIVNAER